MSSGKSSLTLDSDEGFSLVDAQRHQWQTGSPSTIAPSERPSLAPSEMGDTELQTTCREAAPRRAQTGSVKETLKRVVEGALPEENTLHALGIFESSSPATRP